MLAKEPPEQDHPLLAKSEVIVTPNVSYVSEESLIELRGRICQGIINRIQGETFTYIRKREEAKV